MRRRGTFSDPGAFQTDLLRYDPSTWTEIKPTGEYVNRFGSEGNEPGQLSGTLTGVAADGQGRVFVSDASKVSVFSAQDGRFLEWLGLQGTGLAISDDDEVFTANGTKVARLQAAKPEEE